MTKTEVCRIISTDFPGIAKKVDAMVEKRKEYVLSGRTDLVTIIDPEIILSEDIWWRDGRFGQNCKIFPTKPEDYLETKDNFAKLKSLILDKLDQGTVRTYEGYGDSVDTHYADYIGWLYDSTNNQDYRNNIVKVVTEILKDEINKQIEPTSINKARQLLANQFEKNWKGDKIAWFNNHIKYFHNNNLEQILKDVKEVTDDTDFISKYETEAKKTERPFIFEDTQYLHFYPKKTDEELKKDIADGIYKNKVVFDLIKIPEELKKEFCMLWYEKRAQEDSTKNTFDGGRYTQIFSQYDRLMGLFTIIREIGDNSDKFREIYNLLKPKAFEKFLIDVPMVDKDDPFSNVHHEFLRALMLVQPENELQSFWEGNLLNDENADRLLLYVNGLARMPRLAEDRKKLTPRILEILEQRNFLEGMEHSNGREVMEMITDHLGQILYPEKYLRGTFYNFNKINGTLDYLDDIKEENGQYTFNFSRFTSKEYTHLSAKYDVVKDNFEGDNELETSVKIYFEKKGYKLPNGINVDSIEGRKITDSKTKIVKSEQNLVGKYEGIIDFGWNVFPFIYDENNDVLLMAEKEHIDSIHCYDKNKLDKITELIDYSQFMSLSEFGKKIDQFVEAEKKRGTIHSTDRFDLYQKFLEDNYPPLLTIIKAVLIDQKKGLIE